MAEVRPRVAANIVTSENRAAFMEKKLDIAKPLDKVVAPETKLEIPVLGEKKIEEKKEEAPAEKKEPDIKERFGTLAAQRKAAEKRAEAAEARTAAAEEARLKAEREAAEFKSKLPPEPKQDELGAPPKREDFKTDEEYLDAKVAYSIKKNDIEKAVATEKARIEAEANRVLSDWQGRLTAIRKEIPDFDEKIGTAKDVKFSNQVRDAIFESPQGPRILLYYADHRDEAEALKGMTALSAVRAIGRLEADLTPKEKAATSQPKAEAVVSKAPAPISPLKGSSAPEDLVDSAGKFKGDYQQFKKLRKEGKLK